MQTLAHISSQNGREESISSVTEETRLLPWLLPCMEETCQPCLGCTMIEYHPLPDND